ncbi:hypothetical protein M9H77_22709 [Catharanthus roseus]|uniref:Uncharacterized protein n=1 Tax=Catharanthus roseus TaxID=4058 RepID=A0ACC0ARN1_CATRO|nr:hypothetical protein M9H77_22709 [Catharanthus roseus]
MEYDWYNQSWKRMGSKSKREDDQSKLTRDMHNFYHGGGNGFKAYGGNNHGIEDKGRNMEKELGNFLKDLLISLSLNLSLTCYEVSLVELELFLESSLSHVSIIGAFCFISFRDGLFVDVANVSKFLYCYAFLEDSLLHCGSMFDPSCYDFGVMNNASVESIVVGFGLDGALFDILHVRKVCSECWLCVLFP